MIDVGKMISKIRKERGYSQQQLADRLNMSKQAVSNYETGKREPDYMTLEAIADVLNAPMALFVTPEEKEHALSTIYRSYSAYHKPGRDHQKSDPPHTFDSKEALWERREALRRDPKRRILLNLAENGTESDVDAAVALIDALRAANPDFYDGDDPA